MKKFLKANKAIQDSMFQQAAEATNLSPKSIEKDLWVTQVLHALFSLPISEHLIFKGGTSLSKVWHVIDRFSEDIDLAIDPGIFDIPNGDPTKKQIKKLRKASSLFVAETLSKMLETRFAEMGLVDWLTIEVQPNGEGDNTYPEPRQLFVHYQSLYPDELSYLRPMIVLEISARSLLEPVSKVNIHSTMSEHLSVIDLAPVPVITAVAGKTMVEKMFLLHELFSVSGYGMKADRKSRHLYDLYKMMGHTFVDEAIKDDVLWENVRHHREIYTSVKGIDYTPDIRRRIVLIPRDDIMDEWRQDYTRMCEAMIYGDKPTWEELMKALKDLQERIRHYRE